MKISIEEDEEPWDEIEDEVDENVINEIDQEVNENYIEEEKNESIDWYFFFFVNKKRLTA